MHDEINEKLVEYLRSWHSWADSNEAPAHAVATAVGWKIDDYDAFIQYANILIKQSTQCHIADVNDRKIGMFVLHEPLTGGIKIVKLMQRRPGSTDALGLDHVDFTVTDVSEIEKLLKKAKATFEWQHNDVHRWISLRFSGDYEAKFVDHTVLDVGAKELTIASQQILK